MQNGATFDGNYVNNFGGAIGILEDLIANRPTIALPGTIFIATDTKDGYRFNGTSWDQLWSSGGGGGSQTWQQTLDVPFGSLLTHVNSIDAQSNNFSMFNIEDLTFNVLGNAKINGNQITSSIDFSLTNSDMHILMSSTGFDINSGTTSLPLFLNSQGGIFINETQSDIDITTPANLNIDSLNTLLNAVSGQVGIGQSTIPSGITLGVTGTSLFTGVNNTFDGRTSNNGTLQIIPFGGQDALVIKNTGDTANMFVFREDGLFQLGGGRIDYDFTTNVLAFNGTALTWGGVVIDSRANVAGPNGNISFSNAYEFSRIAQQGIMISDSAILSDIDSSAIIEARSSSQGILNARGTNVQRLAIASPAIGLQYYQTNTSGLSLEGLYINKSIGWTFII